MVGSTPYEPSLADKVALLSRGQSYDHATGALSTRETHMSWVFLAGDRVYKLKKPVRFPYLDFSTLGRREAACRAEVSLNRRLAADIYLGVAPLTFHEGRLSIAGQGRIVDRLVVMRRLDERWALEQVLRDRRLEARHLDRLVRILAWFYRQVRPTLLSPDAYLVEWPKDLALNRRIL